MCGGLTGILGCILVAVSPHFPQMTASNLAIVFGPTLLNSPDEEAIVKDMNASHKLIETLVLMHQELFDQPSPQVGGAGRSVRREGRGGRV